MSLFNLEIAPKKKADVEKSRPHPWARVIKNALADKIRHAHNSVDNPNYPRKKAKLPDSDRVQFTIIGNRVTKEFIYCVSLLKNLHKYCWKTFDAPIIKAVTTVEWPHVVNDLKLQYGGLAYCLESQVAVIVNNKFLGGERELRETIEAKYHYHISLDYYREGVHNFAEFIRSSGRSCAYMHISIDDEHVGTLIFMLYSDIVPYTCENFLRLCESKRGGYGGTPVHRIVKDCWIQCGGFGLKSTDLNCENFIIPHDRRGVLGMANDGRNVDCSTQFFVLLQPAPWMANKYVAFGQLIDGESTLSKIESVSTSYESPLSKIIIHKAGVLNLECQHMPINKMTNEYIQGHIEDLIALGQDLYEEVMERVHLEILTRRIALLESELGEEELDEMTLEDDTKADLRATERFLRKKEEIEMLQKSREDYRRPSSARPSSARPSTAVSEIQRVENNEFDVEVYEYEYEPEEDSYKHVSIAGTVSLAPKPEKQFYIPLTDVPCVDDKDSTFDLKKFLKGDYCLESDLQSKKSKKGTAVHLSYTSEICSPDEGSEASLDSEDEEEIKKYLKLHVDRVSFAGSIIKNIARGVAGKINIFEGTRKSELITDEELRRFRLASVDYRAKENQEKKVSISIPGIKKEPKKIKRRQTGFVHAEALEKIRILHRLSSQDFAEPEEDDSLTGRKVRIAPSAIASQIGSKMARRQTGFEKTPKLGESELEMRRYSALTRLYEDVTEDYDEGPTLKDFRPKSEMPSKNLLLTYSPDSRIKSDENTRDKYLRQSMTVDQSYEQVLNLQHGKRAAHKISSDYVKTIDHIEHKVENSLRSIEFAKTRPSMSVLEYQKKNQKHYDEMMSSVKIVRKQSTHAKGSLHGIRLPGDTPLYSMLDMEERGKF